MSKRDLVSHLESEVAIEPQALSGTSNLTGEVIDMKGFHSLAFYLHTDAIAAGSLDAQLKVEESDNADFSDSNEVVDDHLIGSEADTAISESDDKVTKEIGYVGYKRYVRASLVVTSNDGTDVVSCLAAKGHAEAKPA